MNTNTNNGNGNNSFEQSRLETLRRIYKEKSTFTAFVAGMKGRAGLFSGRGMK